MEIEITWKTDRTHRRATEAYWDMGDAIYCINPDRKPTEQELSACPKVFRCFACCEKHPVRELGGRYHERWFCNQCIPFIDEWTAGAMVWWELKRKKQHYGSVQPPTPITTLDRILQIGDAVAWSKDNGYPIQ